MTMGSWTTVVRYEADAKVATINPQCVAIVDGPTSPWFRIFCEQCLCKVSILWTRVVREMRAHLVHVRCHASERLVVIAEAYDDENQLHAWGQLRDRYNDDRLQDELVEAERWMLETMDYTKVVESVLKSRLNRIG